MEKRTLAVKTAQQAFALMKSMLAANMVDNELVEKQNHKDMEVGDVLDAGAVYHLKLVWLKRGDDDLVGVRVLSVHLREFCRMEQKLIRRSM